MPDPTKTVASAAPTKSFLQRMFGSEDFTPEIQQGIDIARKEDPNLAPVEPYGFFSRLMQPNAQAYVNPGGSTIYMNPAGMQGQSPQDVADTLTHEQTHVRQMNAPSYSPTMEFLKNMLGINPAIPYGQRPTEMEAFQNEKNRRYKMGRMQTGVASFQHPTESYIPQGDINLPSPHASVGPSNPQAMMRPVTMK